MKIKFIAIGFLFLSYACSAQDSTNQNETVRKYADVAQKLYVDKNYTGALDNINSAIKSTLAPDATILYSKIKILENLYATNNDYTKAMETTIADFMRSVDKFSFPEDKYADVARINSSLQQFKLKDKAFSDSVSANTTFKDLETSRILSARISSYLKTYPYTYYQPQLLQEQTKVNADINNSVSYSKKMVKDSINRIDLKRAGKRTGISFSYAIPTGTLKQPHESFTKAGEVTSFFNGSGDVAMGAKFAAGVSIGDIIIPCYTSPIVRLSIDWNFIDGEYYQFDWANEQVADVQKLHVIKAGTRIGPSVSFFISKNMSAAIYYSFRPGVQFGVGKIGYGDSVSASYLKPSIGNFNLSGEIGAKFRIGFFNINPFYHFGKFNLKYGTYDAATDAKASDAQCNYKFSYVGVRIGL